MIEKPRQLYNRSVELHPESDRDARGPFEWSPVHSVRWVQCPRCRRRFWYAVYADTPNEELWYWGSQLRQQLLGSACSDHAAAPGGGS